jgi:hypothetical protein
MTSLEWKKIPQPSSSMTSPWFAVSIGLAGFIIGAMASPLWSQGTLAQEIQPSLQQNPSALAAAPKAAGCGCGGGGNGCGMAGMR